MHALRVLILCFTVCIMSGRTYAQNQTENSSRGLAPPTVLSAQSNLKRTALVIGNAAYQYVQGLQNSINDAEAMASKLRKLGYQVQLMDNANRYTMNEGISTFLNAINPGSDALIYYSGHGVELNGSNYLLPIDIPALSPDSDRLLRTEAINLTDLLMDVQERKARVTLVILDACRNNPFRVADGGKYRSVGSASGGLAAVNPPRGTFVLFAAGVGEQALDNLGSSDTSINGLFTRKLLSLMDEPGLEIRQLTYRLRSQVSEAALGTSDHHSQMPSYYDQMLGDFYFNPPTNSLTPADSENKPVPNSTNIADTPRPAIGSVQPSSFLPANTGMPTPAPKIDLPLHPVQLPKYKTGTIPARNGYIHGKISNAERLITQKHHSIERRKDSSSPEKTLRPVVASWNYQETETPHNASCYAQADAMGLHGKARADFDHKCVRIR